MSGSQNFVVKIKDIQWLATLDDSEGYVLSFKLHEPNNSLNVSVENEQEEKPAETETEILLPEVEVKELQTIQPNQFTKRDVQKGQLYNEMINYFQNEQDKHLQDFVQEVNNQTAHDNLISQINYEDLKHPPSKDAKKIENKSISGKIIGLIDIFHDDNKLDLLNKNFEAFKKNN